MSIKIENVEISGWKAAIRGARNPMNSWDKSDSIFISSSYCDEEEDFKLAKLCGGVAPIIKENDYKLLMNLCKGGSEESKWRRFVHVSMDITAPLYWWKEFDTYKIGTACNSCSTMHKIQAKEFTLEDFSCEHLCCTTMEYLKETIGILNFYREVYNSFDAKSSDPNWLKSFVEDYGLKTKKDIWWQMIQSLPSSYNQRRTIDLNYEVLAAQYRQRKEHKLDCWREYCEFIKTLPYSELITMEE